MRQENWQKKVAGHRQRLRDKFLSNGLSAFTDVEILELLFSFGTPRQDCKTRAKEALKRFGSLPGVLEAQVDELKKIPGVGPKNVFAVRFIHEVARTFLRKRIEGKVYIKCASDVVDYLFHSLSFKNREIFVALFLDGQYGIIAVENLFEGTLTKSVVYPREIIKRALDLHAAAMVFAHNHPSGKTEPSDADFNITFRITVAAYLMDMEVLDHIIVGKTGSFFSFSDQGLMQEIQDRAKKTLSSTA